MCVWCILNFSNCHYRMCVCCVYMVVCCVCDSSTSATHLISNNSPRFRFVTRNSNRNAKPFSEINSNELFRIILFVFFVMIFKENSSSCINTKWLHEFHFNSQRIAFESRERKPVNCSAHLVCFQLRFSIGFPNSLLQPNRISLKFENLTLTASAPTEFFELMVVRAHTKR